MVSMCTPLVWSPSSSFTHSPFNSPTQSTSGSRSRSPSSSSTRSPSNPSSRSTSGSRSCSPSSYSARSNSNFLYLHRPIPVLTSSQYWGNIPNSPQYTPPSLGYSPTSPQYTPKARLTLQLHPLTPLHRHNIHRLIFLTVQKFLVVQMVLKLIGKILWETSYTFTPIFPKFPSVYTFKPDLHSIFTPIFPKFPCFTFKFIIFNIWIWRFINAGSRYFLKQIERVSCVCTINFLTSRLC